MKESNKWIIEIIEKEVEDNKLHGHILFNAKDGHLNTFEVLRQGRKEKSNTNCSLKT